MDFSTTEGEYNIVTCKYILISNEFDFAEWNIKQLEFLVQPYFIADLA